MKVYLYDILDNERIIELKVSSFVSNNLRAEIIDIYCSETDLNHILNKENKTIGLEFLDGNKVKCELLAVKDNTLSFKLNQEELSFKRKYARVNIDDSFNITIKPKFKKATVKGLDISFGGMKIDTDIKLDIGTEIVIELNTIFNTFYFDGKIVNIESSTKNNHYGVMFTEAKLRETQSDALYNYILNWANKQTTIHI